VVSPVLGPDAHLRWISPLVSLGRSVWSQVLAVPPTLIEKYVFPRNFWSRSGSLLRGFFFTLGWRSVVRFVLACVAVILVLKIAWDIVNYRTPQNIADQHLAYFHGDRFNWSQRLHTVQAGEPQAAWTFYDPPAGPPPFNFTVEQVQSQRRFRDFMNPAPVQAQNPLAQSLGDRALRNSLPVIPPVLARSRCALFDDDAIWAYGPDVCSFTNCSHQVAFGYELCHCHAANHFPQHPAVRYTREQIFVEHADRWPLPCPCAHCLILAPQAQTENIVTTSEDSLVTYRDLLAEVNSQHATLDVLVAQRGLVQPQVDSDRDPEVPLPRALDPSDNRLVMIDHHHIHSDSSIIGGVIPAREAFPQLHWHPDTGGLWLTGRSSSRPPLPYPALDCLLTSLVQATGYNAQELWAILNQLPVSQLTDPDTMTHGLSEQHLEFILAFLRRRAYIHIGDRIMMLGHPEASNVIHLYWQPYHWSPVPISGAVNSVFPEGPFPSLVGAGDARAQIYAPRFTPLVQSYQTRIMNYRDSAGHCIPTPGFFAYRPNYRRAKNLISNMKNRFDGVLHHVISTSTRYESDHLTRVDAQLDAMVDSPPDRHVHLMVLEGFPGSGKTDPIKQVLRSIRDRRARVALPTTQLRSEWKTDLAWPETESWRFCTYESALLKTSEVLVIDEGYKLPRGYVDLAIAMDPAIKIVIILTDPLQGEYHSTNPNSSNSRLTPEFEYLSPFCFFYQLWTYRSPQLVARLLGVQSYSSIAGSVGLAVLPRTNQPLIVASTGTVMSQAELGYSAITASASQGLTFQRRAQIMLDRPLLTRISNNVALVAVTRSRTGIDFTGDVSFARSMGSPNPILTSFFTLTPVDVTRIFHMELEGRNIIRAPITSQERSRLLASLTLPSAILRGGASHLYQPPHLRCVVNPAFSTRARLIRQIEPGSFSNRNIIRRERQVEASRRLLSATERRPNPASFPTS